MSTSSSFHVCMDDSSDWLHQGTMSLEEVSAGLVDSSLSPPSKGGLLPPLMVTERRLRPPHDQNLKCPRCDSTYTKFCYYNNYNLSQPRYFCKACRRYWTKGGTLRNVPVGGGCRKNKKSSTSSRKSNNTDQSHPGISQVGGDAGAGVGSDIGLMASSNNPNELQLSFPQVQIPPHLVDFIGAQMRLGGVNFMESSLFKPIDFMGCKNDIRRNEFGVMSGMIGDYHNVGDNNNGGYNGLFSTFDGINICSSNNTSPYGHSSNHDHIIHDGNLGVNFVDQRLFLPFDENTNNGTNNNGTNNRQENVVELKHNNRKLTSLEWQDQGYNVNDTQRSWSGMMDGFQSSSTNS